MSPTLTWGCYQETVLKDTFQIQDSLTHTTHANFFITTMGTTQKWSENYSRFPAT